MVESSINGVVDSISIIYNGYDSIIVKWFVECFFLDFNHVNLL